MHSRGKKRLVVYGARLLTASYLWRPGKPALPEFRLETEQLVGLNISDTNIQKNEGGSGASSMGLGIKMLEKDLSDGKEELSEGNNGTRGSLKSKTYKPGPKSSEVSDAERAASMEEPMQVTPAKRKIKTNESPEQKNVRKDSKKRDTKRRKAIQQKVKIRSDDKSGKEDGADVESVISIADSNFGRSRRLREIETSDSTVDRLDVLAKCPSPKRIHIMDVKLMSTLGPELLDEAESIRARSKNFQRASSGMRRCHERAKAIVQDLAKRLEDNQTHGNQTHLRTQNVELSARLNAMTHELDEKKREIEVLNKQIEHLRETIRSSTWESIPMAVTFGVGDGLVDSHLDGPSTEMSSSNRLLQRHNGQERTKQKLKRGAEVGQKRTVRSLYTYGVG